MLMPFILFFATVKNLSNKKILIVRGKGGSETLKNNLYSDSFLYEVVEFFFGWSVAVIKRNA